MALISRIVLLTWLLWRRAGSRMTSNFLPVPEKTTLHHWFSSHASAFRKSPEKGFRKLYPRQQKKCLICTCTQQKHNLKDCAGTRTLNPHRQKAYLSTFNQYRLIKCTTKFWCICVLYTSIKTYRVARHTHGTQLLLALEVLFLNSQRSYELFSKGKKVIPDRFVQSV